MYDATRKRPNHSGKTSLTKLLVDTRPYSADDATIALLAVQGFKSVPWACPDRMLKLLKQLQGDFTWTFGMDFFIETCIGNFVWRDPDYGGDNVIRRYVGTYSQFRNGTIGRHKGKKFLDGFCSDPTGATSLVYDPKWIVPKFRKKVAISCQPVSPT